MKRLFFLGLVLFLAAGSVFALEITAVDPTLSYMGTPVDISSFMDSAILQASEALLPYDDMPDLAKGFANANSYAADAATTRGLMGYKFLTVAVGTMIGFQMPSASLEAVGDTLGTIEQDGDTYFGAGFQALTVSVGLNAGFLVDGLYLTGKLGKFSADTDDIKYDSLVFGLLANYQLVDPLSIGIIKWRGLQVGSGIIYYNTVSDMTINLDPVTEEVGIGAHPDGAVLYLDPTINARIKTSGFKVPVDLISGIRLFWIANLTFGIGADINVGGKSEIALSAKGSTYIDDINPAVAADVETTPGSVDISGGTKGDGADLFRLRAMAGLGFGLGPLKLDIPFTYYFDGKGPGLNLGITGALTL